MDCSFSPLTINISGSCASPRESGRVAAGSELPSSEVARSVSASVSSAVHATSICSYVVVLAWDKVSSFSVNTGHGPKIVFSGLPQRRRRLAVTLS